MFSRKIKSSNWKARTTTRRQGTDSKSIRLGNRSIAKLSFRVKSDSPYWRAGFKLCSPNCSDLPLRSQDSLLFHLGAKEHNNTMRITVYINGEQRRHDRLEYAKNAEVTISFEVNQNNFITCLINDVQVFHERVSSELFKKVYLLAWGDSEDGNFRQYEVKFRKIIGEYRNFQILRPSNNVFISYYDDIVNWFKNNKTLSWIILSMIALVAISTLANNFFNIKDRFINNVDSESTDSVIPITEEQDKTETQTVKEKPKNNQSGIAENLIGDINELSTKEQNTANWKIFKMKDYDFLFKYPDSWYYDINFYQNGNVITFYNEDGELEMNLKSPTDRNIDFCSIKNIENAYFLETNDPMTDLYLEIKNNIYSYGYEKQAMVYWKKGRKKESWIEYSCFHLPIIDNGNLFYSFSSGNREERSPVLYEIIQSFAFLDDQEIEELDKTGKFDELNEITVSELLNHKDLYLGNIDYMKIENILPNSVEKPISFIKGKDPNIKIMFTGNIILEGKYNYDPNSYFGDAVTFTVTGTSSLEKLPFIIDHHYSRDVTIRFENNNFAQELFGPEGSSGYAMIEINNYILSGNPIGTFSYANLVKVLDKK